MKGFITVTEEQDAHLVTRVIPTNRIIAITLKEPLDEKSRESEVVTIAADTYVKPDGKISAKCFPVRESLEQVMKELKSSL